MSKLPQMNCEEVKQVGEGMNVIRSKVMKLPLNTEGLEGGHIDLLCLSTNINPNSDRSLLSEHG